jgi:hypothetical protein
MSNETELEFDYEASAELYFPASVGRRGGIDYRRFKTAALALDFAFTTLSGARFAASALEVNGLRYDAPTMKRLQAERPGA